MFYRVRYVNALQQRPKNTWYKVTKSEPRTYDTHEVCVEGTLGTKQDVTAYAEGAYESFDLASMDIPDEYEDDGKGVFTDPRPIVRVATWLQDDIDDIVAMSESVVDDFIREQEEDADVEGVILDGDMREYVLSLRAGKTKAARQ